VSEEQDTASQLPAVIRQSDGKWKGSGNPAGRIGSGLGEKFRSAMAEELPELIKKALELAKGGDVAALALCFKHAIAVPKPVSPPVTLSSIPVNATLTQLATAVVDAAAKGEMSTEQAASLLNGIGAVARVKEVDELKSRIDMIELALKSDGSPQLRIAR
jgi:hypothetical protein